MLRRFFYSQLPDFAQPANPLMRYAMLRETRRSTRRGQIIRAILAVLVIIALLVPGWQIATNIGQTSLDSANLIGKAFLVLYWPLVFIQIVARIFAIGSTSGVIANEVQHGTWDTLKVTTNGAILTMKSRWATVFYRLRAILILLLLTRIVFIVGAMIDLAQFQGRYLDLLLSGTVPFGPPNIPDQNVSVFLGILTMAIMMTAVLLAPFTSVAFDASVGMLLGTIARGRLIGILGQVILVLIRLVITGAALLVGAAVLSLTTFRVPQLVPGDSPVVAWLAALLGIAEGDMGLTMLHLPHVQRLWADLEYGVLVGWAFLGYTLLQALLANLIVRWAGYRASRADAV
jgi:hypothetical protein